MTAQPDLTRLDREHYISLTTFRRDGTAVATPVWFGVDGDHLLVWTDATSGKVKRVRATPRVTVAICDGRGRVKGDEREGTARLLPAEAEARVEQLLSRKYGVVKTVFQAGSWVVRTVRRRPAPPIACIEISLT